MSKKDKKAKATKKAKRTARATPAVTAPAKPLLAAFHIPDEAIMGSRRGRHRGKDSLPENFSAFKIPQPMPGVLPRDEAGKVAAGLAMDSNDALTAAAGWAGGYYNYGFTEGLQFLGYPYLAELAQRAEYRRMVEVIATQMTRKWIRIKAKGKTSKADRISKITDEMTRLQVQDRFRQCAEQDGFFGRAHLYLNTGDTRDPDELKKPIGDGLGNVSKAKVNKTKPLLSLQCVEAVWTYPAGYNSNDPLEPNWYKPEMWFVMGKQIHVSRLLCFISREVPDLLKPAYSFGGLSMTQMAKAYVDNWLQTRQTVNDITSSFSTMVLKTNMMARIQQGGGALEKRIELFNNYRNNRSVFVLDKDAEEFDNVAAPLGSLDKLQAQAQEHQSSVNGIPLVVLLGITPSGLNASSEGEIRTFYDLILAAQKKFFTQNLNVILRFVQLSIFGDVDEDITFEFEPLWELDGEKMSTVRKTEAETDQIYVDSGILSPEEVRTRIAGDVGSPYEGLDPEDAPDLLEEEEEGLEIPGGRSELQTAEVGGADPKGQTKPKAKTKAKADA